MSKVKINQLLVISLLGFSLTACGGGGGGSSVKVHDGEFKDSSVKGMSYASGDKKGITDKNGKFFYEDKSKVAFSVGGVAIGSGNGRNTMTPIDLVAGGKKDSAEVLNRVRFLMMLDEDDKPSNGIAISKATRDAFEKEEAKHKVISFSDDKFGKDGKVDYLKDVSSSADTLSQKKIVVHTLPNKADAKKHFEATLGVIKANLGCKDAGAFEGSFTGKEKGNIGLILDPTGVVKGSYYKSGTPVDITSKTKVSYETDARNFVSEGGGKKFTGKLIAGSKLKGSWVDNKDSSKKGEFAAERLGSNSGAKKRYTATYSDTSAENTGLVAINVDSNNKVTGIIYDVKTGKDLTITGGQVKDGKLTNVKFKGGEITGKVGVGRNATITHDKAEIPDYTFTTGSGCEIKK